MNGYELISEIGVCTDCMIAREGDGDPDRPADLPREWSLIGLGYDVTMGGEHADSCLESDREEHGCGCGDRGFTQSSCEGCGDHHHGDRFTYTLWRATVPYLRRSHNGCVLAARGSDVPAERIRLLGVAAQWRREISQRLAEDRRFAIWQRRVLAEREAEWRTLVA